MSMPDKDFDALFRSKLEHLELAPSDQVWKGIATELDGKRKRRTLVPVIRIAASVTVVTAVGLFFLMKNGPVKQQQTISAVNGRHKAVIITKGGVAESRTETIEQQQQVVEQAAAVSEVAKVNAPVTTAKIGGSEKPAVASTVAEQPLIRTVTKSVVDQHSVITASQEQQQMLAAVSDKPESTPGFVPDVQLTPAKANADDTEDPNTAPTVMASVPQETKPAKKRHGIRSFGDLINVVVAKVDKRDDKLVEFSNTDGDESTITGVNLGFMKLKKEK